MAAERSGGPLRRSEAAVATLGPWPSCDCSPRPGRRPEPGGTTCPGATVGEVLARARERYGAAFAEVLDHRAGVAQRRAVRRRATRSRDGDEVAVLPPVSGGSG